MAEKKLIDNYVVVADQVPATVNIWDVKDENIPIYEIIMPEIAKATEALLDDLRDELAQKIPIEIEDVTDPKKIESLKQNFFLEARKIISKHITEEGGNKKEHVDSKTDIIAGIMLHRMFGLGFIDVVMADNWLEELAVNGSKNPISVYHKKHGWCKTTITLKNEEEIYNLSSQIGRKVGREITSLHPIMDAHLPTGDRVAATLFPISTAGNT